mmetsp:Transcript_18772/g.28881  ORF Transcript_18772/g.28881 Transcript_18772/m.28881 type:complete len:96 (+) Transcript_18772:4300-4587(+)
MKHQETEEYHASSKMVTSELEEDSLNLSYSLQQSADQVKDAYLPGEDERCGRPPRVVNRPLMKHFSKKQDFKQYPNTMNSIPNSENNSNSNFLSS